MKNIKKMLILILCVILCLSLFGCGCSIVTENEKSLLDTVLTLEEQQKFDDYIDNVPFTHHPDWSSVLYYGIADSVDKTSEIGLKGLPVLIVKSVELENIFADSDTKDEIAEGVEVARYRMFTVSSILRVSYSSFVAPNNGTVKPSDNYYTYWEYVKEKLPEIADSDMTAEEKVSAYRKFGIFAAPYVMEEIEAGNTELEPFFALIGTHLTTAEYMQLTDRIDPTKYTGTPPPTKEEIDAMLIEGAKDFDYKKWYAENKTDIENLEKFLDAYCAEYEAEMKTE